MLLSTLYTLSMTIAISMAQSVTTGSPSATSSAPAKTHTIAVGAAGLSFTPTIVEANVSDIIEFRFYPLNHSVAQAEYGYPCIPYEDTGPNKVGFWSGFHPLSVVLQNPPIFQVRVNDTAPVFFYCAAPGACIEDGMVGVINPNATETFENQLAYARNATLAFSPGEYFPVESIHSSATSSAKSSSTSMPASLTSSTTVPTTVLVTVSPTPTPTAAAEPSGGSSGLSTGAIAGISVGVAVIVILAAALIYLCGRHRTIREVLRQSEMQSNMSFRANSGQMTPIYASGFSGKVPNVESNSVSGGRYSALGVAGFNDRGPQTDEGSQRSGSPPTDASNPVAFAALSGMDTRYSAVERSPLHSSFGPSNTEPAEPGTPSNQRSDVQSRVTRTFSAGRGPHELAVAAEDSDEPLSPEARPFSFSENDDGRFSGYGQKQE